MEEKQTQSRRLFPDTHYSLEDWVVALRRAPSEAEQYCLEEVVHYKARSDMEHEFLIVHASNPSGSKIALGIDRNAEASSTSRKLASCKSSPPPPASCKSASFKSSPSSASSCKPAYDAVQVSHDGTPEPIFSQNERSGRLPVALSAISFRDPARLRPSLLALSRILLTIHCQFPSYALFKYQCYFFARGTCLALIDLCGGVETVHPEGRRTETWCGVPVSYWSTASDALPYIMPLFIPVYPPLIIPTGLHAVYKVVGLHKKHAERKAMDRLKIKLTCLQNDIAKRLTFDS
ncbi:hypothetical protein BJV78DRAFT_1151245 [Lactifluus subvellereus]|nr:hypothetical protein BJV78DRAFT_1151245 [Lactifluus subvellereus]